MAQDEKDPAPGDMAGFVAMAAGAIAAFGSVLLLFEVSPGFVAQHPGEAGWDRAWNHFCYFGPAVLVSWAYLCVSNRKPRVFFLTAWFSIIWFLGFYLAMTNPRAWFTDWILLFNF